LLHDWQFFILTSRDIAPRQLVSRPKKTELVYRHQSSSPVCNRQQLNNKSHFLLENDKVESVKFQHGIFYAAND